MRSYFLRRALLIIPTLFGVTFLVFLITRLAPGGPVEQAIMRAQTAASMGHAGTGNATGTLSDDQIQQIKAYFGYDKPPVLAYGQWLGHVFHGDLGQSFRYGLPVSQVIGQALPVTVTYGVLSLILTYLVSVPLGIVKAMRHRTWIDSGTSALVFIGYAIPGYAVAALLLVYLASRLGWFPMGGFVSENWSDLPFWGQIGDFLHHAVLPLFCYTLSGFAFVTLLAKNQLLDNLAADYVRTAVAKGASFRQAVLHHAFRNSLVPLVTDLGQQIGAIVVGSVLIEEIFDINGMGLLFYNSVVDRDPMVVMGVLLVEALLLLAANLLADVLVAFVDPRVRFE
ncbi:MAG TPA: ABC transporter permease [Opitutaceae bacterium]|jgi:microcin C transport system permease protein